MATYTGLILRIKGKDTKLPDKLKLAKFAWVNESVHIPNKNQQILEFICGLLINKKKHNLSKEDIHRTWETLDKLLDTCNQPVVLKPSILHAVIDAMQGASTKGENSTHLQHVINCTQKLVTAVVTSQFDTLCDLLGAICDLILRCQPAMLPSLVQVEESTLVVLGTCLRSHLNQCQVLTIVSEKLLNTALLVLNKTHSQSLLDFLLACLLHVDHMETYATFLEHHDEDSVKFGRKYLENSLSLIVANSCQRDGWPRESFLAGFLRAFVQLNKSNPRLCFELLRYVVKLLTTCEPVEFDWMKSLADCVTACQDCDLTSGGDSDLLKWFFDLTARVVEKHCCTNWFAYMRAVLGINHVVVEKFWKQVIGRSLLAQLPDHETDTRDLFLGELILLYVKLRRTSDLLDVILKVVVECPSTMSSFKVLPHFHKSLCVMFNEVPQTTMLELLEKLHKSATDLVRQATEETPGLTWTLSLLSCLLTNCRLLDQRSGGLLYQKTRQMLHLIEADILTPLFQKNGNKMAEAKELLSTWTLAKILHFPRWRENVEKDELNDVLSSKLVQNMDQKVKVELALQRTKLAGCHRNVQENYKQDLNIKQLVSDLFNLPVLTETMVFTLWSPLDDTCILQKPLDNFIQFKELFPLIGAHLEDESLEKCVDFIVRVLSLTPDSCKLRLPEETSLNKVATQMTSLHSEVQSFLGHPATCEHERLTQLLAHAIWKQILQQVEPSSPKKKKRKQEAVTDVVEFLTDVTIHQCVCDISTLKLEVNFQPHLTQLISTLGRLHLEYQPTVNLKSQVGLLILLKNLNQDVADEVHHAIQQQFIRALSVPNLTSLFECVLPTDLLTCVLDIRSQMLVGDDVVATVVAGVMNDHKAVLAMSDFSQMMITDVLKDYSNHIKLVTMAMMLNSCQKYLTKQYHMIAVKDAALNIFFNISKFTIKHGMKFFQEDAHSKGEPERGGGVSREAREGMIECLSAVLTLWSAPLMEDNTNKRLKDMVGQVLPAVLTQLKGKESCLRFLEACCLCQLRVSSDFALLSPEQLEEIWQSLFDLSATFFCHPDSSAELHPELAGKVRGHTDKQWLGRREAWPKLLDQQVEILTSLMACWPRQLLDQKLQMFLHILVRGEVLESVFVVTAVWRSLLRSALLSEPQLKELFKHNYQLMCALLSLLDQPEGVGQPLTSRRRLLSQFIVESLADLLELSQTQVTPQMITLCLHAALTLTMRSPDDLKSVYRLSNSLLVYHTVTALTLIPGLVALANKLLKTCMQFGGETKLGDDSQELAHLTECSNLVARLLTLFSTSTFRNELSKVAHTIIGTYILELQQQPLHTHIKRALVPGIYKLMSICDKFRLTALNSALPPGVKDTFKVLHQDYEKYHRYTGLV
ncbi:unhealthy ribosome biogenesis protein 2 homolog isoform X2 [Physella acuta]|uniref:unhealthy ribosome biogenesis protein 2 homolog isoform X2 n=1 Tax=Physella acuta TaxID=109671 RepID=UPI0027DB279A|nr:unhealthy ribosome biogenesis protein 2 homolog isoform X2 [Physella acuta]